MSNVSIARRYARALLEVASEANALDAITSQLRSFVTSFEHNPELQDVLVNPAYSANQRTSVVNALMGATGEVHPLLLNTMRLLTDRNRLAILPDISRQFAEMADAKAGRVRGQVTSAVPLDAGMMQQISQTLERITQRNVVLETKVDPAVLGGVSAQVGSFLYDGTLKSQLEAMRRQLKGL